MGHDDDQPRHYLTAEGLTAYVEVHGTRSVERVVLCRACGIRSPPLDVGHVMDWFKRHAAEVSEEHHRAKSKRL